MHLPERELVQEQSIATLDDGKISKFPIAHRQRQDNTLGARTVECILTGRRLVFDEAAIPVGDLGSIVFVDVLPAQVDGETSRLFRLAVSKEDLQRALNMIEVKDDVRLNRPEQD